MRVCGVVLAAGQGKRMRSALPKVMHKVGGLPMIRHVCDALLAVPVDRLIVVLAPASPEVTAVLPPATTTVWQDKPLGTGDAARRALPEIAADDLVVIACGDTPLLLPATLQRLLASHASASAEHPDLGLSLVTAIEVNPEGYGRIVRDRGRIAAIVEEGDLAPGQSAIQEINAGIYCCSGATLLQYLPQLEPVNMQGEYQLTDVVRLAIADGRPVSAIQARADEVIGVNSRAMLASAEAVHRRRKLDSLMAAGVTVIDPASTYVDAAVSIGRDTVLWPQTYVLGTSSIGAGCEIGPGAHIESASIGNGVAVKFSAIEASSIGDNCIIGPYAHLRPDTRLAAGVKIGNYAELKNTSVGAGSKVPHHSYLGDAQVGEGVNIGAGVVSVNYDGRTKQRTTIADGAFIGCNANLVAPVTVGERGYVACGSSITDDVPPGALAIARARQTNVEGWVARRHGQVDGHAGEAKIATKDKGRTPTK